MRRRHTILVSDWSSDVCSSDLSHSGLDATGINDLALDPQNPGTVYAATNNFSSPAGVFKSTDGGAQWTAITSGLRAKIGRASCRERVYVSVSAVPWKKHERSSS